jgi:hypothetical protein
MKLLPYVLPVLLLLVVLSACQKKTDSPDRLSLILAKIGGMRVWHGTGYTPDTTYTFTNDTFGFVVLVNSRIAVQRSDLFVDSFLPLKIVSDDTANQILTFTALTSPGCYNELIFHYNTNSMVYNEKECGYNWSAGSTWYTP